MTVKGLTVYLASPLGFSRENDDYRERIKRRLRELKCTVLDPWDKEEVEKRFQAALSLPDGPERTAAIKMAASYAGGVNADAIREADLVLAVLDGTEPDSGTVAEVGFAAGIGKRCYGLRTDFRDCGDLPGLALNLQLQFFLDHSGGRLFRSIRDIDFGE
jgi:nucleoside 2-deoxyribosyltransferase